MCINLNETAADFMHIFKKEMNKKDNIIRNIRKNFIGRKLKISAIFLFFALLVASIVLKNFLNVEAYYYPAFFVILIFFLYLCFEFGYKIFIWFSLILMLLVFLFILIDENPLSELSGIYAYIFLGLGVAGLLLDYVREKVKKNSLHFKNYKLILLFILILVVISPFILYRSYLPHLPGIIKNISYYYKRDSIKLDGIELSENIIINVEYPEKDVIHKGIARISGWAVGGNSSDGPGIDEIEVFIDGKPGIGKRINLDSITIEEGPPARELVEKFYSGCYGSSPDEETLDYWVAEIESGNASFDDMFKDFILDEEFKNKNLSDEEYVNLLYGLLLNREADKNGLNYWLNELNEEKDRDIILYDFLNSFEYRGLCRRYYNDISEYLVYANTGINLKKEDIGDEYGEQFEMSGFNFLFDSREFKNGKHTLYIYAHSPEFGWDYEMVEINIEN